MSTLLSWLKFHMRNMIKMKKFLKNKLHKKDEMNGKKDDDSFTHLPVVNILPGITR